jgi:hypothetical protein
MHFSRPALNIHIFAETEQLPWNCSLQISAITRFDLAKLGVILGPSSFCGSPLDVLLISLFPELRCRKQPDVPARVCPSRDSPPDFAHRILPTGFSRANAGGDRRIRARKLLPKPLSRLVPRVQALQESLQEKPSLQLE